jgi:hypothetical protein
MSDATFKFPNPDNLPVIPARIPTPAPVGDGAVAMCGACGMRLYTVMHYVCVRSDCPLTPRVTL